MNGRLSLGLFPIGAQRAGDLLHTSRTVHVLDVNGRERSLDDWVTGWLGDWVAGWLGGWGME